MHALEIVKTIVGVVVSGGVGVIVGNVIKHTTPEDLNTVNKVLVGVGTVGLAGYLALKSSKYTEDSIQSFADTVSTFVNGDTPVTEVVEPQTPAE